VIALARVLGTPLQLGAGEDEPLVRGLPPAERKVVSDARIDLLALVPAHDETSRQLLIAMGPKRSEEPYSATDIDLVNGVADALSLAAEHPAQPGQASAALEECPACGKCFDSGTLRCPDDRGPLEPARMTRILAQRYRLDRRIGEGGMGRLYGAVDLALDREVAVKVIREEWLATPGSEERFRREARLAAAIGHPNIVTVFDFGVSNRTAFLVMELLHGRTLREELRERQTLPLPEVLSIVRSVGLAVGAAHARGLIHRDLKPENIWLTRSDSHGRVKVLDFGLARPLAHDDEFATGSVLVGTPRYLAPEQLRGERPDTTSDCWALAVIAYELLTGEPPFVGEAAGGQYRGALGVADQWTYPSGPRLPAELQALEPFFARALAIDPSVRPADSAALVAALENAAAGVRIVGSGAWTVWG
jgi:tRNA A-37 threonylcarbamoyl transferase component Bud32